MVEEHERAFRDSREETDGSVDAVPADLEVFEAAALENAQPRVVGGEEGVEGLREDIDDTAERFAVPVEGAHLLKDEVGVGKVGDDGGRKELREEDDVIEGYGHAATRQGVPHVHCVA